MKRTEYRLGYAAGYEAGKRCWAMKNPIPPTWLESVNAVADRIGAEKVRAAVAEAAEKHGEQLLAQIREHCPQTYTPELEAEIRGGIAEMKGLLLPNKI